MNEMKRINIDCTAMTRRVNMRQIPGGGLEGVGIPSMIRRGEGAVSVVPGLVCRHGDGTESYFHVRDGRLYGSNTMYGHREVAECGNIACGVATADGVLLFDSVAGPRRFAYDGRGRWSEVTPGSKLPPLTIVRRDAGSESVAVDDIRLEGSYDSRNHELSLADRVTIGAVLDKAYSRLADTAAASHRYIQPVLARYELVGHDGRLLYRSAPVMVSPAAGVQGVSAQVRIGSAAPNVISGLRLTATSFAIGIDRSGAGEEFDALVAEVRLTVSPQLHPCTPGLPPVCAYGGATSSEVAYTLHVPGHSHLVSPGAEGGLVRARMLAVLGDMERAMRPYDMPVPSLREDLALLGSLRQVARAGSPLDAPHGFRARVATANGDTLLYGGLTAIPFDGYRAAEIAVSTDAAASGTPTAVLVTMADGSSVVSAATAVGAAPGVMSPLLTYPSASARKMLVICGSRRREFALEPAPGGGYAYCLAADCAPVSLADTGAPFVLPAASPAKTEMSDMFALARADAPLDITVTGRSEAGAVTCVSPAPKVAWGISKPGFYVMGRGGIVAVAPSVSGLTSSLIDPRAVTSATAAAVVPGGVAVVAGNRLLRLSGTKAVTLMDDCRAGRIAFSAPTRELWLLSMSASVIGAVSTEITIFDTDTQATYTRTSLDVESMVPLSSRLLLIGKDGTERDTSVEENTMRTIELEGRVPFRSDGWTRVLLTLPLFGRGLVGTVTVTAWQGDGARKGRTVATLDINGDIDHPVTAGILLPHCHRVGVTVKVSTFQPKTCAYDPR